MQTVPLSGDSRQSMTVRLGDQEVRLRAWWQPLTEAWYLSLETSSGEELALGRQVASRRPLIKHPGFAGDLAALPLLRGDTTPLGMDAWGGTHQLVYLNPEEVREVWGAR